jgi:NAD(P)-dependent dehydrogenase (short-subunit alcohol dehydrogenase family)
MLKNTTAIVTGGASGMGEATARRLSDAGATVVILDRDAGKGEKVASDLGGRFVQADVTNESDVSAAVAAATALAPLRTCIHCAGIGWAERTINRDGGPHTLASFRTVIEINLIGTFNVLRLTASGMSANQQDDQGQRGVIINTASIAAFEGQIGQVAYTAAKAGIAGMSLTMARDLGSLGIRVNTIAPSLFATGLTAGISEEFERGLTADAAFPKRMGRPDEYARLAVAIIENPMLNGGTIRLDAGQRFAPK